jgi:hypothetical protein
VAGDDACREVVRDSAIGCRSKDAPERTQPHYDFIRASEETEKRERKKL